MKIRSKLLIAFGVLVLLVMLVSGLSLKALSSGHDDFAGFVNEMSMRVTLANDVLDAANARAIAARNMVLSTTAADREAEKAVVVAAHDGVKQSLLKLKAAVREHSDVDARERELFAAIESVEERYGPVALDIVNLASGEKREAAIAKMNIDCRPLLAALVKAVTEFEHYSAGHAKKEIDVAEAGYRRSRLMLVGACAAAACLAVFLGLSITGGLMRSLGAEPTQLGEAAKRVASGDLRPVEGTKEAMPGSVLASLATMQDSLATVVGRVRGASDSIATGSAQIAIGNADLSQRTEEQASSLEETAASMEQMNATVKSNAETAVQATRLAGSASAAAERGGEMVAQVVQTMEEIKNRSAKIADIIGVIDGIAFQTNILALNAAVESARAGEHGRGFAVVAGEVRSLAQRSADAAKEIKSLISGSVEQVEEGARLVGGAGTAMDDIVAQVKRVATLIGEISTASMEQTSGIGQVSSAVAQLDQVTQQNAALVEESAAAAESLKNQAQRLAEAVAVFKLRSDEQAVG